MKPALKYRGGKSREISMFEEYIPKNYDRYIEPFIGGGAVFFCLEPKKSILNDINEKLITFYRGIKEDYSIVRQQLDELQQIYENNVLKYKKRKANAPKDKKVKDENEELYYDMRDRFNYPKGKYHESVLYYFINKTAYSGMIRYNKKGEFNVPYGRYKNFNTKLLTKEHRKVLKNAKLYNTDYSKIFSKSEKDDFMFLDPPYDTTFNSYGNYNHPDFDESEQKRLAKEYKSLECKALMVINQTRLTYNLYKDYIVKSYDKDYSVNIKNRFDSKGVHLIVKNY